MQLHQLQTASMAENSCFNFSNVCHSVAVVKELLSPADKPGLTPFSILSFFSLSCLFSFPFFLYSHCWPCWSCTWINIYFKLKSGVFQFGRGISKALDLHTGLRPDKNQKLSRHVPPLKLLMETAEFFSMLVDIMTNNAKYTTNCTLPPTPTSEPLAKVKLSFCTLS